MNTTMSFSGTFVNVDVHLVYPLLQAYLVYKYRVKNNEVKHTTMMSKGGGSRQLYGNKPTLNTDTITSNANSTFERYADKSNTEGESESLLEKDIQFHSISFVGNILYYFVPLIFYTYNMVLSVKI